MYDSYEQLSADLKTKPADFWVKKGEEYALELFHRAAEKVPAYQDFLSKNSVDHKKIITIEDFKSGVPVIDKENYIYKYSLSELCWNGDVTQSSLISQSSGTTGSPHFWPRFAKYDKDLKLVHEVFFKDLYNTDNKKTLFVVCFYLGAHIAGVVTTNAVRDILSDGMKGSIVTAGINKKDIFSTINKLSPLFDQTILMGYPPFLRDIILDGKNDDVGIDWKKINLKFMFSAESFPENWRDNLYKNSGINNFLQSGFNVYGCSEVGFMGKFLENNSESRSLFGLANGYVPAIYQYHPWNKYFESINNHLVCTSDNGLPLIRYDIKDIGVVYKTDEIKEKFSSKIDIENIWNLPIITVFGRSDYTATIYGVNVYPEHIKAVIAKDNFINLIGDKFFLKTVFEDGEQSLEIHLELLPNVDKQLCLSDNFSSIFFDNLLHVNIEYHKLYDVVGKKVKPKLFFYENGSENFYSLKAKNKYIIK